MKTVLGLILVGLLAFLGSALFRFSRLTPPVHALIASGATFFFVGILLGPHVIGLLGPEVVLELDLLANLGVGWVGLLFGLQFRYRDVRKLTGLKYLGAMTESIVTLVVVGVGIWLVVDVQSTGPGWLVVLLLAAIGSTTSSNTGTATIQKEKPRGTLTDAIRLFESLDAVPAVVVVGLALCFAVHPTSSDRIISNGMMCAVVAMVLGVIMGVLFHLLTLYRYNPNQLLVIVLGLTIFCSGAAHYLQLSSLFVNFIVGLVVANCSRKRRLVFRSLVKLEKPFYLVLLTMAGAMWTLPSASLVALVPFFLLLRMLGKLLGGAIAARVANLPSHGFLGVGPGILAHDGMAFALALNIKQFFPNALGDLALMVTIASIMVSNLVGPWALRRMLLEEKEIL